MLRFRSGSENNLETSIEEGSIRIAHEIHRSNEMSLSGNTSAIPKIGTRMHASKVIDPIFMVSNVLIGLRFALRVDLQAASSIFRL